MSDRDTPLAMKPLSAPQPDTPVLHKNMRYLIQLRWIAAFGQITTIICVSLVFGVHLPMFEMFTVLAFLIAFNIGSQLRWHETRHVTNNELFLALLVDVACLTAELYLSGGTANPFAFLYLLQVILSAVLLEAWSTWIIVAITFTCLCGLALFSKPLALPLDHNLGLFSLYVQGVLICFALNAALLVIFIGRINGNLREGDAQLAALRQRHAEEEHIVRMGLLASGAAHELGTPLATLAVILGDWRRLPEFKKNTALQEEIEEMQTQLQRCKSIVSGILMSAGEARGESSAKTSIAAFFNDLVAEWRAGRQTKTFEFENYAQDEVTVVFDSTVKQTIFNLLDNALEASPDWLRMEVILESGILNISVSDHGLGFPAEMLVEFGKPYQSSKGRAGGGLGLFLAVNVSRRLGGTVKAYNRVGGGALVQLSLPLAGITIEH